MFDSSDYPRSLEESQFEQWLEEGRESKLSYAYMLIMWNETEQAYFPTYLTSREQIDGYNKYGESPTPESMIAAYDLYSESKVA